MNWTTLQVGPPGDAAPHPPGDDRSRGGRSATAICASPVAPPGGAEPRVNTCTTRPAARSGARCRGPQGLPARRQRCEASIAYPPRANTMDRTEPAALTAEQQRIVASIVALTRRPGAMLELRGGDRRGGMTFARADLLAMVAGRYWARRLASRRARSERAHLRPGRYLARAGHPSCWRCGACRPVLLVARCGRWERNAIACGRCRSLLYRCGCDSGDTEVELWRGRLQCQNCGLDFGVVTRRGRKAAA